MFKFLYLHDELASLLLSMSRLCISPGKSGTTMPSWYITELLFLVKDVSAALLASKSTNNQCWSNNMKATFSCDYIY